jgi:hypothetical protein
MGCWQRLVCLLAAPALQQAIANHHNLALLDHLGNDTDTCKLLLLCTTEACLGPHFQRGASCPLLQRQLTLRRLPLRLCTRNPSIGLLHTSIVTDPTHMHMSAHV